MSAERFQCEVRYTADETRQTAGRLTGVLMPYETRASDRPEIFATGSLRWPSEGILIREQHRRDSPILRAVPFVRDGAVHIDATIPDTQRGRDAATNIREGVYTGLSIEFHARDEGRRGDLREVRLADLVGAGLVDDPSYGAATVQVRQRADSDPSEGAYLWL